MWLLKKHLLVTDALRQGVRSGSSPKIHFDIEDFRHSLHLIAAFSGENYGVVRNDALHHVITVGYLDEAAVPAVA